MLVPICDVAIDGHTAIEVVIQLTKMDQLLIDIALCIVIETVKVVDEATRQSTSEEIQLLRIDASAHDVQDFFWFFTTELTRLLWQELPTSGVEVGEDVGRMRRHVP